MSLTTYAEQALQACSLVEKFQTIQALQQAWEQGAKAQAQATYLLTPGRPERPELVPPKDLPRRKTTTPVGHAAMLHAVAHIEFNAINLALDALYRFPGLPDAYYEDWLRVTHEEVLHFRLLCQYLEDLGYAYGAFPAHNGLWEMAMATRHDVLVRMALIPRVMEARGLDVTPGMIAKFEALGDTRTLNILRLIQQDEIGHVRVGSHWFTYLCEQRQLEPTATFAALVQEHAPHHIKAPLALDLRQQAGFAAAELTFLETVSRA